MESERLSRENRPQPWWVAESTYLTSETTYCSHMSWAVNTLGSVTAVIVIKILTSFDWKLKVSWNFQNLYWVFIIQTFCYLFNSIYQMNTDESPWRDYSSLFVIYFQLLYVVFPKQTFPPIFFTIESWFKSTWGILCLAHFDRYGTQRSPPF